MKTYLLPENGAFYKANLHCHSTCSDGEYSPEELKQMYMAQGYSAIAYTDHSLMIPHPELTDENFVALTGYEIHFTNEEYKGNKAFRKGSAINCISPAPEQVLQPCYHRTKYPNPDNPYGMNRWRALVTYDENAPDFTHEYTPEKVNEAIRLHKDLGFFVTYNHPGYNLETVEDFTQYVGMDAMEITNWAGIAYGTPDYNEKEYDDFLRAGYRISCIATDDNHNHERSQPGRTSDSFGGFTMIKAETLDYVELVKALKAGNMYASQGPLIHELYVEDGKVFVTCSDAYEIRMNTQGRRAAVVRGCNGEAVNCASFPFTEADGYIRITVTDHSGKHANTRAYFVDEM